MRNSKPFIRAALFLLILTILDFLFRKGLIAFIIPVALPPNWAGLALFTLFALAGWQVTRWFCKTEQTGMRDLGISFNSRNRLDFYIGFLVGVGIWAAVSLIQGITAGFSWELRTEISLYNILYGLVFIFYR